MVDVSTMNNAAMTHFYGWWNAKRTREQLDDLLMLCVTEPAKAEREVQSVLVQMRTDKPEVEKDVPTAEDSVTVKQVVDALQKRYAATGVPGAGRDSLLPGWY